MKNLWPAILAAASLSAAAAESPGDFAFAVPIEGLGADALHRVAIPQAVYESAAFSDLRDLRVFNGAGEMVPYAFRPVDRISEKPAPVTLPIFPLRGPRDARSDELDLSFDKSAGKVSVRLSSRGAKAGPQALLGYLIDASSLETALNGIEVDWGKATADRLVSARLEAGDDLKHWTTLAADAPLGGLVARGPASGTQGDRVSVGEVEVPAPDVDRPGASHRAEVNRGTCRRSSMRSRSVPGRKSSQRRMPASPASILPTSAAGFPWIGSRCGCRRKTPSCRSSFCPEASLRTPGRR